MTGQPIKNFWLGNCGSSRSIPVVIKNTGDETITNMQAVLESHGNTIQLYHFYFYPQTISSLAPGNQVNGTLGCGTGVIHRDYAYKNFKNVRLSIRQGGIELMKQPATFWLEPLDMQYSTANSKTFTFADRTVLAIPAKIHDGGTILAPDKDNIVAYIQRVFTSQSQQQVMLEFLSSYPFATTEERGFILGVCDSVTVGNDGSFCYFHTGDQQNRLYNKEYFDFRMDEQLNSKFTVEYCLPMYRSDVYYYWPDRHNPAYVNKEISPATEWMSLIDHRQAWKNYYPFLNWEVFSKYPAHHDSTLGTLKLRSDLHYFAYGLSGIPVKCRVHIKSHLTSNLEKEFTVKGSYKK